MRSITFLAVVALFAFGFGSAQQDEIDLIKQRRKADLSQFPTPQNYASVPLWLRTQENDGTWPDVVYTAGCDAQRANWPIQQHWIRVITLASVYTGLDPLSPRNYTGDQSVLHAASIAMDYWFANDYKSDDCIGSGGKTNGTCPCGTPGLWNTNWFDQVILIPQLCSTACLLLSEELSDTQKTGCHDIPIRAYNRRDDFIQGLGYLTGANTINEVKLTQQVMQNSVSLAIYTDNATMLSDALDRAMAVVTFTDKARADGIHRDGSFLQHDGILYNGNYGKDLLNAFIQLEGEAIGTSFAANESTRAAFATDVKGSEWMIYVDKETKQEHWDFNVVGRFIAFNTADLQAISDINFNVTKLAAATADFVGENDLSDTVRRLESNGTEKLEGNKIFHAADYMVHRREDFVIGTKLLSNRSHNTETTNGANMYGYHLGQGTMFTYVNGYEYRDIEAQWHWNLIPGTTVLLDHPKLNASIVGFTGKTTWVGGVSDGWVGMAVEDYVDPYDGSLAYKKAWFYLDDSVLVTTTGVSVNSSVPGLGGVPVVTVLDNRAAADGGVWLDDQQIQTSTLGSAFNATTLYYGGNGYLSYGTPFQLTVAEGNRTGNWSAISTSTQGVTTGNIFSAYTAIPSDPTTAYTYAFFPAASPDRLASEASQPTTTTIQGDGVLGVAGAGRLQIAFWPGGAMTTTVSLAQVGWAKAGNVTVTTSEAAVFIFATNSAGRLVVTLADPGQSLPSLSFSMIMPGLSCEEGLDWDDGCYEASDGKGVQFRDIQLPRGGFAGASVFRDVQYRD